MSFPLGPFLLDDAVGRGGMAVVWRAHHREQQRPVAIKVLTSSSSRDPVFLASFRSEARGASVLDHPGIVSVYDHGVVSPADAATSGGALVADSPYLVMELAGSATLVPHQGRLPWEDLSATLLALLDALAHAHARGVIHRDLKPANVLVDEDQRVRLTDFGLAHAVAQEEAGRLETALVGTPAYMAPEQLEARWRDYGPWTDLYALGCLAWALTTGEPPHGAALSVADALDAHFRRPLPSLLPVHRVPGAFEGWLRRLLAREPRQRFQRAADAAWALQELGPASRGLGAHERRAPVVRAPRPVAVVDRSGVPRKEALREPEELSLFPSHEETRPPAGGRTTPGARSGGENRSAPPLPADWRRPYADDSGSWLRGVGLGTYALRRVPLVDRAAERDRLWAALHAVRASGGARAVVLEGPAGGGKTRLADWIAERAHEVGAATPLRAVHDASGGPGTGLGPMLSRFGRLGGLERGPARRRIARLLADRGRFATAEIDAVEELVRPPQQPRGRKGIRFRDPAERMSALRALLDVLSRERPLLLVLDDVQEGAETLEFVLDLLRDGRLPVLLVLTVRDDVLAERPVEAELLTEILDLPAAEVIPVGPLPPEHRGALVRGLLGLEGDLADAVEQRTAGNPLFAVQLVGDWVARGLLEVGQHGFRLRPGADPTLPDDLHAVWAQRIERALGGVAPGAQHALEIAAVLGHTVSRREWEQACALAELPVPQELVESLADQRLVSLRPEADGWAFAHGMLAESLARRARDGGRLEEHHDACAAMLLDRRDMEAFERRGRHLQAAGRHREALQPLARAINGHLNSGELRQALGLASLYEAAIAELRRPASHPAAVRGRVLQSRIARVKGDLPRAEELARSAVEALRGATGEGAAVFRDALVELGNCRVHRGELAGAREDLETALRLAQRQGAGHVIALCRRQLSYVRLSEGELAAATREARESVFAAEEQGDSAEVAHGYQILSRCVLLQGRREEAAFLIEEARVRFERAGARWGVATTLNSQGEIARESGEAQRAERAYREAAARYKEIGSKDAVFPNVNLGLLLVDQRRWRDALDILLPLRAELGRQRRRAMEAAASIALLAPLAAFGRWEEFDQEFSLATRLLAETGFMEPDLASKAELGGRIAAEHGAQERAARAYGVARVQWMGLGRVADAERVSGLLASLPDDGDPGPLH